MADALKPTSQVIAEIQEQLLTVQNEHEPYTIAMLLLATKGQYMMYDQKFFRSPGLINKDIIYIR